MRKRNATILSIPLIISLIVLLFVTVSCHDAKKNKVNETTVSETSVTDNSTSENDNTVVTTITTGEDYTTSNDSYELTPYSELIKNITISEETNADYDRESYTSSSQHYTNSRGEEFSSIRNYSYYSSTYYNFDEKVYTDPYNGKTGYTVKQTDYDHIIPLHYVNQHGGSEWTDDQKKKYADDPTVGVAVNSHDNRAKGDKGPSKWMPDENKAAYCYTWLVIADKYDISLSYADADCISYQLQTANPEEIFILNTYI